MGKLVRVFSFASAVLALGLTGHASAAIIELDFFGNAGPGLLPGNEVGSILPGSLAFGGETGAGLLYDDVTNTLAIEFSFSNLTGGLAAQAGGGMHLHLVNDPTDPLNSNGNVEFLLNVAGAPSVTNLTPLVNGGATGATVSALVSFTNAQEADLLAGNYYLNIHSFGSIPGELRGNLVTAPEPTSVALLLLGLLALTTARLKNR